MNVFQLSEESRQEICCDLVCSVVIVTIAWEISLNNKVCCNSVLITDCFYLCIFNCRQGIYYMRETCDTGCKGTVNLCIDQSHLCCFIVVFVMHIVDHVQCSNIQMSQPVHHLIVFLNYLVIVKILRSDRLILRSYLLFCLLVNTAVDGIKKTFRKVCTSAEELDLFTCLCSRYTAADAVVIAPYRTHYIVILILNGTCCNRNICSIFLKVLRQSGGIKNSKVRFRSRSHILQCMKETEITLCYHMASVNTHTCHFQGCPYRVSGKQLVVRRNTGKFYHTEFHNHMVNKLLSLFLCKDSSLKVSLNINIKESGDTSNTHCSSVLSLDSCKVSEIQPLECFSCILCRLRNIKAVGLSHSFHSLKSADLVSDLLTKLEVIASHTLTVACCKILLFALDQSIDSVKSHTSVIAYNTSAAIGIRKTCQNFAVTGSLHFRCINVKHTLVVCFKLIVIKNIFNFVAYFIAVSFTCFFCHFNTAVWHKGTFQRFVCLKTYNSFQIFQILVNISRTIRGKRCYNLCLHIQNSALCALFFLQLLKLAPEFICCLCRPFQERSISVIWCIIHFNKVTYVNFFFPAFTVKTFPL